MAILYSDFNQKIFSFEINTYMIKKCSKCGEKKDETQFDKCKLTKNGLYPSCKDCRKLYRLQNKEFLKQKDHEYYEKVKHTDHYKEVSKAYYKNNKEKIINRVKEFYLNNKEHVLKRQQKWVQEKNRIDPTRKLISRIRASIRRKKDPKRSKSLNYTGTSKPSELHSILSKKCDEINWLNLNYHIDHIWQVHWFSDAFKIDPEKVAFIVHHHRNLIPIPAEENLRRSKYDFTPLKKDDLIFYQDILNKNVLEMILKYFNISSSIISV